MVSSRRAPSCGESTGDRGGLNPVTLFFFAVATVGLLVTATAGYLVIRGPFLGGETLDPFPLLGALFGFVLGIVCLSWGGTKAFGVGARI